MKGRRGFSERFVEGGASLLGLFQRYPHIALAEIAALCGYDFLVLDEEHGVFTEVDLLRTLQTLSFAEMAVLVRLRGHDLSAIGRYLDMGVDGLLVPSVSSPAQARELVRAMEYPPAGTRGMGASAHRATRYGKDIVEYMKSPRAGVALLVIVESAAGVANVEEILSIDGVDGVIVGPSDLSADLGTPGEFSHPEYTQALHRIEQAAVASGKMLGTAPHAGHALDVLHARGHRLFIVGSDTALIREAMTAQLAQARALCDSTSEVNREIQ